METLTEFVNFFSQPWMKGFVILGGVLAFILKLWRDFSDFRYSTTLKRPLERLTHLNEAAETQSELANAVRTLKHLEIFRIAFGVRTSPQRSEVLLRVFQTGKFSAAELRVAARFIEPAGDLIAVKIDLGDRVAAWLAIGVLSFLTLFFLAVQIQLLWQKDPLAGLWALVLSMIWVLAAYFFGGDIRNLRIARETEKKLAACGLLAS